MEKLKIKIKNEFIDTGFGFPVRIRNVSMVKVRGAWTPKINYNHLADAVLNSLAFKPSRLTGAEIKFIRTHFKMTLQEFAKRFCVTHVAVIKWEKTKNHPTVMSWTTEKDVRLFILSKLQVKALLIVALYTRLEKVPDEKPSPLDVEAGELAA
jgi:transcriptional regulator with XRE-family HTH domain